MLNLYVDKEVQNRQVNITIPIVNDVEAEFRKIELTGSEIENKLIQQIDKGKFKNKLQFIDRFDQVLPTKFLSTGCKAALVALHTKDKLINLDECGFNARDIIIRTLKDGNVMIRFPDVTFAWPANIDDMQIDVQIDGYRFTSLDRLNTYFSDERPFPPDLTTLGISKI